MFMVFENLLCTSCYHDETSCLELQQFLFPIGLKGINVVGYQKGVFCAFIISYFRIDLYLNIIFLFDG